MSDDDPPYEVGYRKPPQTSRFKTGQSGNPKGRPRGARNFDTVLAKELDTKIAITENGKRKKISKREVIGRQLVNRAVSGDPKFVPILLAEARRVEDRCQLNLITDETLDKQEDKLVLESILARLQLTLASGEQE